MKYLVSLIFSLLLFIGKSDAQGDYLPGPTLTSSNYCNYTFGTVSGATAFFGQANCDNYVGTPHLKDVFYNFTAVETTHIVSVRPIGSNSDLDVVLQVIYDGGSQYLEVATGGCVDPSGGGGEIAATSLTNLSIGTTYYIRIYDYGNTEPVYTNFEVCVMHVNTAEPDLVYSSQTIDDDTSGGSDGNDDGQANPAEDIELSVELFNSGNQTATNVSATLSTNDSDITITDDSENYSDIDPGDYETNTDFDFEVSSTCPDKDVLFQLDITSDEGSWTEYFNVHIYAPNCTYSISPTSDSFTENGGSSSFSVSTISSCSWNANVTSGSSWISITNGNSETGSGTVSYAVSANSSTSSRTGSIEVEGETHSIYQDGSTPCNYSLNATSETYTENGGSGSFSISTVSGCSWSSNVTSGGSWITITSGNSGTGSGAVNYTVSVNPSTSSRTGYISAAGVLYTVNQLGSPPCSYTLNPTSDSYTENGGSGSFSISTTSSCSWNSNVTSGGSWITITSSNSGTGAGTVSYTVSTNSSTSSRTGLIEVEGETHSIYQDGSTPCNYSLNPSSDSFTDNGGFGSFTVSAASACVWNAIVTSGDSWITITSGNSGTGSGTVNYSVAINTFTTARTGIITVGGVTHTISQDPFVPCTYSMSPSSNSFIGLGGSGTVETYTENGCYWSSTVASGSSWITITSGNNGFGPIGIIDYSVAANTSSNSRTGEIKVGPASHLIFQDGADPCTYTLSSGTTTLPGVASSESFQVQPSSSSCSWNAQVIQGSSWLTITTGNSGTGNGTISFSATENNTGIVRYATISIEGVEHYITQSDNPVIADVELVNPVGGETFYIGDVASIYFNVYGNVSSTQYYFSSDNGVTWSFLNWDLGLADGSYVLTWNWPTVNSTVCKFKVVASFGPNGFDLTDESEIFTVTSPSSSNGVGFSLNSTLSHLYWPYENSTWNNRDGWSGGQGGPNRPQDGLLGGSGHGEGGHDLGEYYADDWNRANGDCDNGFKAPISGTVIFVQSGCTEVCSGVCSQSCCGNGFGNAITIRSDNNPDYAFKVSHLNDVFVFNGQHVSAGELIGDIGSTGASTGSHAHCTLYRNISDSYSSWATCEERLALGLSCGINNQPPYAPNSFACNFMFDAVQGGTGGGEQEFELLLSGAPNICQGESITITPSITGVSYAWNTGDTSPTINVTENGIYHVVVTDASGNIFYSELVAVTIQAYAAADIWIMPASNYCLGDTIWLSALDMSNMDEGSLEIEGYTVEWSNGMTDLVIPVTTSELLTVSVSDPIGCQETTDQIDILFYDVDIPTIENNDGFLAASIGQTYQWYLNGSPILDAIDQFYEITESGYYIIETTDDNGCSASSEPLFVSTTSLVDNQIEGRIISIFPNPNNGQFALNIAGQTVAAADITILNSTGKKVWYKKNLSFTGNYTFDLNKLPNGVYTITLQEEGQRSITKFVLVR